jgi:hypothetical protein
VFVWSPVGSWHQHAVLAQRPKLLGTYFRCLFVFAIAGLCFDSRPAPRGNSDDLKRVRQSLANKVNMVTTFDSIARSRAFTVQFHMTARNCGRCTNACLEEAAVE